MSGGIGNDNYYVDVFYKQKFEWISVFNGDSKDNILWRNSSTGTNALWNVGNSTTGLDIASMADRNVKRRHRGLKCRRQSPHPLAQQPYCAGPSLPKLGV